MTRPSRVARSGRLSWTKLGHKLVRQNPQVLEIALRQSHRCRSTAVRFEIAETRLSRYTTATTRTRTPASAAPASFVTRPTRTVVCAPGECDPSPMDAFVSCSPSAAKPSIGVRMDSHATSTAHKVMQRFIRMRFNIRNSPRDCASLAERVLGLYGTSGAVPPSIIWLDGPARLATHFNRQAQGPRAEERRLVVIPPAGTAWQRPFRQVHRAVGKLACPYPPLHRGPSAASVDTPSDCSFVA
jgi:hypothetical protein